MIRAILFTAVGFWLSRQYYLEYDAAKGKQREQAIQRKLIHFLTAEGLNAEEIEHVKKEILG